MKTKSIIINKIGKINYATIATKIPKFGRNNEITKNIKLRTSLNEFNFRNYLFKYFRDTKFTSQYIYVLCKVSYIEILDVRTIGFKTLIDLNHQKDIETYVNNTIAYFKAHDDGYHPTVGDSIIISYLPTTDIIYQRAQRNKLISINKLDVPNYFNIPWIINYKSWANLITDIIEIDNKNFRLNSFIYSNKVSFVNVCQIDSTKCRIELQLNDNEIFTFVDTDFTTEGNGYRRYFEKTNEIVYFNNSAPFFYVNPNVLPKTYVLDKEGNKTDVRTNILSILIPERVTKDKIGTYDLETFLDHKNNHRLLAASVYIDSSNLSVYRNNFVTEENMLDTFFDNILTEENNNAIFYAHNSATFDLIFILDYLLNRPNIIDINPLYKDGKFLSLVIKYNVNSKNCIVTLRDSLLILLTSLDKLCKTFKVETQKDIYPYDFPNEDNLHYVGDIPSYKFFDHKKLSLSEYKKYCNRFKDNIWNLEEETIKYCELDTKALYQVIKVFESKMLKSFNVNIHKSPTLASLTMRIYRTKYLKDKIIPNFNKNLYDILVQSYFGGHVDLYIPNSNPKFTVKEIQKMISENKIDELDIVNGYDINALYPSVMKDKLFPTELLYYFKGNNTLISEFKNLEDKFTIYKVKVTAPVNIQHPILPVHDNGRSIYPTGTWEGWYNSEEIKNAMKYNYTFEILEGFVFEKDDLFSEFVSDLYKIRQDTDKNDPMNFIAKILLNSLYGKFGINPNLLKYKFITETMYNLAPEIYEDYKKVNNFYLVGVKENPIRIFSNVAIAQAVTSYSRIKMSIIKNNPNIILLYSDTDSAYIIGELPKELVDSKELGLFKLEGSYLKFIALAPKVYGTLDINGTQLVKVKGFKNPISLEQIESLLMKNSHVTLKHKKWFRSLNNSTINIRVSYYDLKINDSKRISIYDNNKFSSTLSIVINR